MFDLISNRKKNRDLFNNFFSDFTSDYDGKLMKIDIKETDSSYIFDVELPGINKEDVNVSISEDTLTIAVIKSSEEKEDTINYIRRERRYGTYSRSFTLSNVDNDNIRAKFDNGLLTLELPKEKGNKLPKKNVPIE